MAVSPSAIRTRLKTILEDIDGVRRAHKYAPRSLSEADCPQFLIVPAEAEHQFSFSDGHRTDRIWRLVLFVAKAGAGIVGDNEQALDPFFERVENKFAAALKLDDLDSELISALILTDSGPGIIDYPPGSENKWFGCEWEINIETKRAITTGT